MQSLDYHVPATVLCDPHQQLQQIHQFSHAHILSHKQQECLKQVGLDPETGKVDIDKVEGRTPKSERDKARVLLDIIKELSDEYGGRVPVSILTDEMSDRYNVSEEKVEQIITKLKQQGLVFEPTTGYLKTV